MFSQLIRLDAIIIFSSMLITVSCTLNNESQEKEFSLIERPARELDEIVRIMEEDDADLQADFDWVTPAYHMVYAQENSFNPTEGALIRLPYYDGQSDLSGPDFIDYPEDGWVLMSKDFGIAESARKGLPFFSLYNTESGILRFMFLNVFGYGMSQARVSLGFLDPNKSGSLLHGMDTVELPNHIPFNPYFEASRDTDLQMTGGWGVVDFELQFDPNLNREAILDFNIYFVTITKNTAIDESTGEVVINVSEEKEKYQHIRLSIFDDTWLNDGTTYKNLYKGPLGK